MSIKTQLTNLERKLQRIEAETQTLPSLPSDYSPEELEQLLEAYHLLKKPPEQLTSQELEFIKAVYSLILRKEVEAVKRGPLKIH